MSTRVKLGKMLGKIPGFLNFEKFYVYFSLNIFESLLLFPEIIIVLRYCSLRNCEQKRNCKSFLAIRSTAWRGIKDEQFADRAIL